MEDRKKATKKKITGIYLDMNNHKDLYDLLKQEAELHHVDLAVRCRQILYQYRDEKDKSKKKSR